MTSSERDTICAPATAPGRAGVAVIRVSGPEAFPAVERLTGRALPAPRHAVLRDLVDPRTQERLDQGLVLIFPGPNSFTGQDVAEFQVHGGAAVLSSVMAVLTKECALRLADPGEFTRRAFENGKLDLTEIEGLADLISAETEAQRRLAVSQFGGALSGLYEDWRSRLVRAGAMIEAGIDFSDEELPEEALATAGPILAGLFSEVERHLADMGRGERLREGLVVALVGPPNAGKSTLMNALAKREVAIVTDQPGTTRDVLEVHLDLEGYPVTLIDLAGLRETSDVIEAEGVRRALDRAARADVRVFVSEGRGPHTWADFGLEPSPNDLVCRTKSDLDAEGEEDGRISISAKASDGLEPLIKALSARARKSLWGSVKTWF